jgi:hypothetical protein
VTLVIVTHDDRILPFADRILRLEDGRITREEVRRPSSPPGEKQTDFRDDPAPFDSVSKPSLASGTAALRVLTVSQGELAS